MEDTDDRDKKRNHQNPSKNIDRYIKDRRTREMRKGHTVYEDTDNTLEEYSSHRSPSQNPNILDVTSSCVFFSLTKLYR